MNQPPAAAAGFQRSLRRDEKQGRAFGNSRIVRVFSGEGYLVARLDRGHDEAQIERLLQAPNAVPVEKHGGKLVGIRLLSFGDDRGHTGERHGSSTITTERIFNDEGLLVGTTRTLKHKAENVNHAEPPPAWAADAAARGPLQPPLTNGVASTSRFAEDQQR